LMETNETLKVSKVLLSGFIYDRRAIGQNQG
jgi:hypothetical protein